MKPTSTDRNPDIDVLLSKQALHELIAAYCRAVDRADEEALASLFHPDATVTGGVVNGSGRHFAHEVPKWLRANAKLVFHTVTNEWFVVDGNRAAGESYVLALSTTRSENGDQDTLTGGRYLDRFERREGVWKFVERTFVMDCNINQPCTAIYDDAVHPPGQMRGAYKPDDPSYRFWRGVSSTSK
jgi:hypothetical protein